MNECNSKIIDCKSLRENLLIDIKKTIDLNNLQIKVAVIMIGDNSSSQIYVTNKISLFEELNIKSEIYKFSDDVTESEIINLITKLNNDDKVTGIFMQLPIAKHLDSSKLINLINVNKDVDRLTAMAIGQMYQKTTALLPCTASGVREILLSENIKMAGKNAVVIGRSILAAKPIAQFLENENATVTICHSQTQNIKQHTKNADILVVAIGVPKFIDESFIKDGATVIDVGINRVNGKVVGDIDFDSVISKVSKITTVPGGVGLLTVTELASNLVKLKLVQQKEKENA